MHPENSKRLKCLGPLSETEIINGESYLEFLHTKDYIKRVKMACSCEEQLDPDTVTSLGSYSAAIYAVGATIMASDTGDFAIVRPPGHHAHPDHSSGFCIFNNIAITASKLAKEGKRVLIFDFDGHLGDGTSKIFYTSDQVLYWSIHQYPAFPGGGYTDEIGEGKGKGFTVNAPLPPGSGDDIFMSAVDTFLTVAKQFDPDIVAVSAGFDAHLYDLLLDLRVSANSFYKVGMVLRKNFRNIFATLEGGYNVEYLPKCIYNFLAGINGKAAIYKEEETTSARAAWEEYILREGIAINNLSNYWKF